MKRKQRKFGDKVQLVVDEMLHMLGHSSLSNATPARGRSLQLTKLEERVLMSASPMAMVAEIATMIPESSSQASMFDLSASSSTFDASAADLQVATDAEINATSSGYSSHDSAASETTKEATPAVSGIELIVIDSRVQDADTLLTELLTIGRDFRILRLDSETDGVAQITEKLEQIGHVSAIHLLTHGTDGEILLGSTVLNTLTLAQHAPQFLAWQHNLTDNADLLLYGCDVAETTAGQDFVDALASLAETDVAASTDATGSEALGGDWDFEFASGFVEATTAFRTNVAQNWNDLLNVTLTDKSEFAVNATASSTQITSGETRGSQDAVSLAADGSYVVVWSSLNQDGAGYGVYARRFDAAGNPLTSEILINQTTSSDQQWARVASADDGTFLVTWTHGAAGGEDVFFRKFAANGTPQTAETRANNTTTNSQKNSVIAMDRTTGQFVIAWQGEGPGDTSSIFFRRFTSDGTATDLTDQLVNTAGTHSEQDPAIAMQTAGGFVIAFERGDSNKVFFQRFNGSGTKVGSETQIDNVLSTSFGIDIASNAAGDFTVVYREQNLLPGIWQRGFNADGTQKYTWSQISSGDGVSPSIAMMDDGSYILTWQKTGDGDGTGIYARRYNSDGSANGTEFLVNSTTTGAQSQPSVAALDAANFVVVWSGQGTGDTDGVFARLYGTVPPSLDLDANNSSGALGADFNATYIEGGGAVSVVDSDATLTDADDANLQSLTVTITNRQDGSSESLAAITTGTSITAAYASGVLTLSGSDTVANYQQVLRTITYNNSVNPATGTFRAITFVASDGVTNSPVGTTNVAIENINEQPIANDDTFAATEDQILTVPAGSGLLANDVEPDGQAMAILDYTLPSHGTLALNSDGAFNYTPEANYYGSDAFSYVSIDSTPGLIHYWKLDGNANDLIGVSNGTINGATTVAGERGNALQFNGTSSYVEFPDFAYTNEFSVAFSFKVADNAGTGYQYIYSHGAAYNAANALNVYLIEDSTPAGTPNILRTRFSDTNDNDNLDGLDVDAAGLGLLDNQWHQYVLTVKAGAGATVYIDGVQRAQIASGGDAMAPTGNLFLGARADLDPDRFYNGQLDSVMFFSRPLETSEVSTLHSGGTATGSVTINVANVNDGPTLTINSTLSANEGSTVTIDRPHVLVSDIDNTATQLTYTLGTAPLRGQLRVDGTAITTGGTWTQADIDNGKLTYSHNGSETTSDSFTFTVSDGSGGSIGSTTTNLTITAVNDNSPTITSNGGGVTAAISVAENSTTVTTVTATDADLPAQTLTYSISGGADAAKFSINSVTGALTFVTAPNFESPTDSGSNNVYDVVVRASDGTLADTQTIAVTVTAVNEHSPTITSNGGGATAAITVVENSTTVTTVTATDADLPGATLTYSINGGADAAKFAIDSATGALRFVAAPNFEAPTDAGGNNIYDVTVRVSDGSLTDTQAISITVTNSTTGDIVIASQDTYITSSPQNNNYGQSTSLIIDKSGGGIGNGRALVQFDLTDIPANSTITSAVLVMQATQISSATAVNVYQVTQAWSEGSGNGTAGESNWDRRQTGVNWTSTGGDFATTIVATMNATAIGQHTWDVTSLVTDWKAGNKSNFGMILGSPNTGSGTVTYDSAEGSIAPKLLVTFDISNAPPVITSNGGGVSGSVSVAENSIAVTTVTATDANAPGQTLTYSISGGADAARFAINSSTGVLTFAATPNFESPNDAGANNIYDVTVQVSDGITTDTQAIAVTVTNVNEAPVMTAGSVSLGTIAANQTSTAMTVSSFAGASISDPDAGAMAGIAVTASSGTGTWQYSTNGVTWNSVGTVSSTQALLLRSTDSVRFVGSATSAGTASLMYAAWDQTGTTSGQQGTKVSLPTLGTGGSTPFSSTTNTANLSLLAVNQAPVATSDTYSLNEGSTLETTTAAGWFSPDWNARQRISFNNAPGTALTDHVVLVTLNPSNFDYANAQAAGQDLRFVDGDGTLLNHEIEQWNPGGTSQIWVRVPQINALSTTDFIWMYNGNAQASDAQNASSVWAGQQAVLHMNGTVTDSSPNAIGVTTAGTTASSGVTSGAQTYDGVSSTVQLASNSNVDNLFAGGGTVSAWINPTGWGEGGYGRIADKASSTFASGLLGNGWGFQVTSAGKLLFQQGFTVTTGEWVTAAGTISLNTWQQVAVVYDSSSISNNPTIYINGVAVSVTRNIAPVGIALTDAGQQLTIGNYALATSRTFAGRIDEFRAIDTAQSAASILAQYKSVVGTLATIGAIEAGPGGVLNNDSDPESSPLSVSLVSGPAHAASFTLNADGSFQYTHNGSETTADSFTYRVSDGIATSTATVNLTIRLVNDNNPVVTSNGGGSTASINVAENSTAVTTVTATDADLPASTLTYSISGGVDAALFSINATTGALSFTSGRNYETPSDAGGNNVYDVIVQASDGSRTDTQSIAVTLTNANDVAPAVTAGQVFSISENAKNNDVIGTILATDADGSTTFSNWTIVSGNTNSVFRINTSSGQLAVDDKNELDAALRPTYTLMVRVSDSVNTSSLVAVTVNVTPFNEAPNANAGSNLTINEGGSVTLDASASDDPDGDTISYRWDIDNDGVYGELSEPTSVSPTLTWATLNSFGILDNGTFTVGLQVDDGQGGTDIDTISLTVNNVSPAITSANTISVNENVSSVMTITSTDPADSMTYSITGGSDQGRFTINSVTGALSFVAPANFEAPTDSNTNNVYVLQVTATDGDGGSVNQTILVTVANVNETPSLTIVQPVLSLTENTSTLTPTSIASLTITDDGTGTNTLSLAGADAGDFEIVGTSLRLKAGTSLNFEAKTSYSVQVVLNDTTLIGGPFATQNITLNITNVDESPTANAGGPYAIAEGGSLTVTAGPSADPEGLPLTYQWDIDNDGAFDDATGSNATLTWAQLRTLSIPVNDSIARIVRVRVTDVGGNSAVDSAVLAIADTAPTINVTGSATAVSGTPYAINIATSDPGNDTISSFRIVWGDGTSQIVSGTTTTVLHTWSTPGVTRSISVTATDENGTHAMTGGPLLVTVGNTTPSAISLDNVRVPGFTPQAVVGNVTFVDPDIGDSHTITVSDARFQVVSGVLRLKVGTSLNPNIEVTVPVTITVTDLSGGSASATFVVEVNRAPVATTIPVVTAAEDFGTLTVSTSSAFTDPDGDALTYSMGIVSQDAGLLRTLAINSVTGQMTATSGANRYGSAVIDVTATDRSGASSVARFTVNVQPVNDAPVAQDYSNSTFIDSTLTVTIPGIRASVSDVDGDSVTVALISGPASGSVVLMSDGSFVYTPALGFQGIDVFRFVASDGVLSSNVGTVRISVVPQFIGPGSSGSGNSSSGFGSQPATTTTTSGSSASTTTSSNAGTTSSTTNTGNSASTSNASGASTGSNGATVPGTNGPASGLSSLPNASNDNEDDDIFGVLPSSTPETTIRSGGAAVVTTSTDSGRFADNDFARRTYTVTQRFDFDQVFNPSNSDEEIVQLNAQRESLYRQLSARVVEQSESVAEQLGHSTDFKGRVVGSVGVVTTGFSVGYLFWAIRGGMLVSGLLAQVPAWTMLDPLLVIDGDQKDEDKESLQNLMDRQQAKMNQSEETVDKQETSDSQSAT